MSQSNGNSRNLTIRQEKALAKLLQGRSITAAARKVGVRRETIHHWMKQPAFRREYHDGCKKLRHEIESRLIVLANKATSVVERALDADNTCATSSRRFLRYQFLPSDRVTSVTAPVSRREPFALRREFGMI